MTWADPADLPGDKEFMEKYLVLAQATCIDIMDAYEVRLRVPCRTSANTYTRVSSELRVLRCPQISQGLIRMHLKHSLL